MSSRQSENQLRGGQLEAMNAEAEMVFATSWKPRTEMYQRPHGVMTNPFERRTGLVTNDPKGLSKHERFIKIFLGLPSEPSTARLLLDQIQEDYRIGRAVRLRGGDAEISGVISDELRYQVSQPPPEIIKSHNYINYRYVGHVLLPAQYTTPEGVIDRQHCLMSLTRNAYPSEMPPSLTISVPSRGFELIDQ